MDKTQQIQEDLYKRFPYHYVAKSNNGFSQTRNLRWGYEYLGYLEYILSWLKKHPFESLLDVGCGDGKFLFETQQIFPDRHLEGIDYSEHAIAFARAFNPKIQFSIGALATTKTERRVYDVITLIEVLEHIPPQKIQDFLSALQKRLGKKGILIITVPSLNHPIDEMHYQHFDTNKLKETLMPYFVIESMHFLNQLGLLNVFLRTLLSNRLFILNQHQTLNFIFAFYKRYLLRASSHNAKRIVAICKKAD